MFKFENIKCLFFDLDNTLVRCSPLVSAYFIWRLCESYKKSCSPREIIKGLYNAKKNMRFKSSATCDNYQRLIQNFADGSGLKYSRCLEIYERSMPDILHSLKPFFKPIAAAKNLIEQLESRFILVLATNALWPEYFAILRLRWALIDSTRFLFMSHAKNMKHCKPHVEYYKEIINSCNNKISPETCLYIGDNYTKDAPATKAGLTTIILSSRAGLRNIRPASLEHAALYEADYKSIAEIFGINL